MPDVLIRGIGIPSKSDLVVHIYPDGKAIFYPFHSKPRKVEVLELPQHGDLISRDAVLNKIDAYVCGSQDSEFIKNEIIKAMPVIVPSEKGDTQ